MSLVGASRAHPRGSMSSPSRLRAVVHRTLGPAATPGIVAALLLAHAALLLTTIPQTFITVDEVMNVVAGVSYWRTGRFFIYRVNPPPPKMLAVLPALAICPLDNFHEVYDQPSQRAEFQAGPAFVDLNRTRIFKLVCLSRLAGVVWSVIGGWFIFHWCRELYGWSPGCLSLALWCCEPYILGHAALVTTDVPAAVAGLVASYAFWRFLKGPSWRTAILAGISLGMAALTKFTLLVFFVLWPILWLAVRWLSRTGKEPQPGLAVSFGWLSVLVLVGIDVINLGYACQGTGKRLGDYRFVSQLFTGASGHEVGNRFHGTWLGSVPVPLPEDFLKGIDVQRVDFEGIMPSYLAGVWNCHGWWYYYLYALAVKLPLGTLVLMTWGLWRMVVRRGGQDWRIDQLALLAPAAAILFLLGSQTGYTQHSRYAIPVLPYLIINAGRLAGEDLRSRWSWSRRLAWGLLLATAMSSLHTYPHSLSYFNEAAGGPLSGHHHLIDSNIDWGQDLLYLKAWADEHPEARPLKLAYYNYRLDPRLVGLAFELPPPGPDSLTEGEATDPSAIGPLPGYYAISVNFLRGCMFHITDGQGGTRMTRPHEFEYFRAFRPIARAGFSIYIYHITVGEADAVRARIGLPPVGRTQ